MTIHANFKVPTVRDVPKFDPTINLFLFVSSFFNVKLEVPTNMAT